VAKLAVVIPTRNRPDFAVAAVRSLLDQDVELDIYLSDNSADPEPLRAYCARERRATWLRPERELAMPDHWEWALQEVLNRSAASHVSVHYDRKISKPGEWRRLAAAAERHPATLLTYSVDQVCHWPPPIRVWQAPWTGRLFAIETAVTASAIAEGRFADVAQALPILSNCVVPRETLEAIAAHFGDICKSTGPDSAFMSRFLALAGRYIHLDRATGIIYGGHRSNGLGYLRGSGGDFPDFLETFGNRSWLEAAPLPGINLGQNMLYHEYELARRASGDRLPPLDRAAAIAEMAGSLVFVDAPELRTQLVALLRHEGWTGEEPAPFPPRTTVMDRLQRTMERRALWRRDPPPHICGFAYRSEDAALNAALRYPRRSEEAAAHLAGLLAEEVA
jgi:glycosyltransferase involved in cell wall biosynthesis